jgi:dynein heavy chain, axonemal
MVEKYVYDRDVPYFNILVPTTDTVKFGNVMGKLISNNNNLLLSG